MTHEQDEQGIETATSYYRGWQAFTKGATIATGFVIAIVTLVVIIIT